MLRVIDNSLGNTLARREWLRLGLGTALGTMAPSLGSGRGAVGQEPAAAGPAADLRRPLYPGFGRAKSVILVYASGGQSQLDMWDPKPEAPVEIRGAFAARSTRVPGVLFCEHMPRLAALADRFALIRSMSHEDLDHGSATYLTLTGRYHRRLSSNPDPAPEDFPTYGAVLKRHQPTDRFAYDAVYLNGPALVPTRPAPGQYGGLLGEEYAPLILGDMSQQAVAIPGLTAQPELPVVRMHQRQSLRAGLNQCLAELGESREALELNHHFAKAYEVLASPKCREAFDLQREPEALKTRYGRYRSGQACLLARRLVEAGVPLVTVMFNHTNRGQDAMPEDIDSYGWDTHNDIFSALQQRLLPRFDQSLSALIEDLDQRGLLEETLLVCMGEFGRAPRVAYEARFAGASPGRKHWASVYSILLAGAGVARGAVVGASDRFGGEPVGPRYGPWDVAATMYSALGIDPRAHYHDSLGRPFPLSIGKPIESLYS